MKFRNAFRILTDNFSNIYKLLIFRLVTGVLFFSIAYVIINRGLHEIFVSPEAQNIVQLFKDLLQELATGTEFSAFVGFRDEFIAALGNFLVILGTNMGAIIGSFIGICVIYLMSRFLNGTATFAMASVLNDRMTAYSKTTFSSAYFKNLGKSMLYQLIYVPLSFIYEVASVAACWFFFLYTPSLLPSWGILTVFLGLALSITGLFCLLAVKMTFISAWIPAILSDGKTVREGCSLSFKALKGFGNRFSNYLISIYLIFGGSFLLGICTFGSFLLLSIPAGILFILCLQLVFYYEDTGKKYFLSFRKISGADEIPDLMGE